MSNTILFIDASVLDYETLISNIDPNTEVHLLNANEEGVLQIATVLAGRDNVDAIHIISHGSSGSLSLGAGVLNNDNVLFYSEALAQIGASLSATGDILLYGCDVAQGEAGVSFINQLAAITGADVAASNDLTGSSLLGGDWNLEYQTGNIETTAIQASQYAGVLPITELFISEYIEGSSFNKAIEIYNGTGAAINLSASGYTLEIYANGSLIPTNTITLSGTVANGDVFVLANAAAGLSILTVADQTSALVSYNGNDAVVLKKAGTVIDAIGQIGFAPVTEWGTGLISTADNTLRRNGNISTGDSNPNDAFAPAAEWIGYATDTFDGLGSHSLNSPPSLTATPNTTTFTEAKDIPSTAVAIDSGLTISDDGSTLATATVTISGNYQSNQDVLLFQNNQTGAMGNIVGNFDSNTGVLSLQSAGNTATLAQWQAALRAVSYLNTSDTPDTTDRTLSFIVNDGALASTVATKTVSITATNDTPTFMLGDGIVTTAVGSSSDWGQSVTVQADGKILVAGTSHNGSNNDFALTRYNSDGSLDTTFDGDGKVTTAVDSSLDWGQSVTVQADGKILVAGYSSNGINTDFALTRYNSDGSLDTTFDSDGKVTTAVGSSFEQGYSVTVQVDGKILVTGYGYNGINNGFALVRYNVNGSLDTSFDSDGKVMTAVSSMNSGAHSVAMQADGKILVAGQSYNGSNNDFALVRYNSDGSLDTNFDSDGIAMTAVGSGHDQGYSVTVQADSKILVAGTSDNGSNLDFALVRYNSDGSLDTTFDGDGKVITAVGSYDDYGQSVTMQADGKILVAGYIANDSNWDFALIRYNSDGSLDTTFDNDGKVITAVGSSHDQGYSITVQADGKILVAGTSDNGSNYDFALIRYNSDGSLDTTFDGQNTLGGTVAFTEGDSAVILESNVTVSDSELNATNYNGATLTLARTLTPNTDDVFSSTAFSGSDVIVSSTTIGTFTQVNGSLIITFNTAATQALVNQALRLISYSNSSDNPPASVQIDWTFNDGNTSAQGTGGALTTVGSTIVNITATNDAPVLTASALTISEGGTVVLSSTNLAATDADLPADTLTFTVSNVAGGAFKVGGSTVTSFTAAQIASGAVSFVHNGSETPAAFDVTVGDGVATTTATATTITYTPVNDNAPVLTASALTISEGGTVVLSSTNLAATDTDLPANTLTFTVSNVAGGAFKVGGSTVTSFTAAQIASGAVSFVHNGSETAAAFDVTVGDGVATTTATAATITYTPVNDNAPVLTTSELTISEGGTVVLSSANLATTDADLPADTLTFTVSNVAGGTFKVAGSTVTSFTAAQIASGAVSFVHNGSETAAAFDVTVGDGVATTTATAATITYTPVNDNAPVLTTSSLTISEGGTVVLSSANLAATDADLPADTLTFTVSNVAGGAFKVAGSTVTSFTAAQIASGAVSFVHNGSETAAAFDVTVGDGVATTTATAATITYTPVNDAPTATNLTNLVNYTQGLSSIDIPNIVVNDADANDTLTATLTLANPNDGILTISGNATYNTGTGEWIISGAQTELNTALAAVSFIPTLTTVTDTLITTHIRDALDTGPVDGTITLHVTPLSSIPTPEKDILIGSEFNDKINALAGDDIVYGNAGNDELKGQAGDDTLFGDAGDDTLFGGVGSDLLNGGTGKDKFILREKVAATDTVKIAAGDSLINHFDIVSNFTLGKGGSSTVGVDQLDLNSISIAANTSGSNGINARSIHSHAITNGIITFDTTDRFNVATNINSFNLNDIVNYLQRNIGSENTVAFNYGLATYVFQDGGTYDDTLVELDGVIANSLSNSGLEAYSIWLI